MIRRPLAALVLSLAAITAAAQFRTITPEAKRGVMSHVEVMTVLLNGAQVQLAPGAQIRDDKNMAIIPVAIPPGVLVKYLLDAQGQVSRVWILSPQEAAQPDPKK
jgi:hypothetical protein